MSSKIDADQMRRDFAGLPEPAGGGMTARARKLVEEHCQRHGPIPQADSLIDEIAAEMGLLQIYGQTKG